MHVNIEALRREIVERERDAEDPEFPVPPGIRGAWLAGVDAALEVFAETAAAHQVRMDDRMYPPSGGIGAL